MLGYFMVDEVYAAVLKRYQAGELTPNEFFWYFLGSGINLASLWWITTVIGWGLGNVVPASTIEILAFTIPLIFLSIVIPLLVSVPKILAALSAAITGVCFAPLPHSLNLLVAAWMGFIVDAIVDEEDMVIKSLPDHLKDIRLVAGITISGRNEIISILNVQSLLIRLRVHGNVLDAQLFSGTQDADGDLATVGNQDLIDHFS